MRLAQEPTRRTLYQDALLAPVAGRAFLADLIQCFGMLAPHLPTARAAAQRDVVAFVCYASGVTANEAWTLEMLNHLGPIARQVHNSEWSEDDAEKPSDDAGTHDDQRHNL